jgi:DNA-binding response OmpR family regulator
MTIRRFFDQAQTVLNRDRQVFLVSDADRAFELAQNVGFSLALVDLDLPGEDGFALVRKLRETVPGLSIIAITSAAGNLTRKDAAKLGVAEVLTKPITPDCKPIVEQVRAIRRSA